MLVRGACSPIDYHERVSAVRRSPQASRPGPPSATGPMFMSASSRYEHGSDAVHPAGLILSAIVVGILLFTGWKSWEMVYRGHVGVSDTCIGLLAAA